MNAEEREKSVIDYYRQYDESARLQSAYGQLEFAHMSELLLRYFPAAPARVCDIGGAAGDYTFLFAGHGYEAFLLDIVPHHIELARKRAEGRQDIDPAHFVVGDALALPYEDNSFDAVFLGGPLYHLTQESDRVKALREAWRVLKPGGVLTAYAIGRFSTYFYGIHEGLVYRDGFSQMLRKEVDTGRRYSYQQGALDNAYFHDTKQLRQETAAAGFRSPVLRGVIGAAWMTPDFDERWQQEREREIFLDLARMAETIPDACSKIFIAAEK